MNHTLATHTISFDRRGIVALITAACLGAGATAGALAVSGSLDNGTQRAASSVEPLVLAKPVAKTSRVQSAQLHHTPR